MTGADRTGLLLVGIAVLLRIAHAAVVTMPSNDGAHYLAMAREIAAWDWHAVFGCVFHPGSALLPAVLVRAGCEPFVAARVVAVALSGLTTWVLWCTARRVAERGPALLAVALFACGTDPVRLVGEAYSEPTYLLCAAVAVAAAMGGRPLAAGLAVGAAFWTRPEGLALAPLLLLVPARTVAFGAAALVVAALPVARWCATGTFALTTKLGFMAPMGPFGESGLGAGLAHFGRNLLEVPMDALFHPTGPAIALGCLGAILLLRTRRPLGLAFVGVLALGIAAMTVLQVKPRFFLSHLAVLVPATASVLRGHLATTTAVLALLANLAFVGRDLVDPPRTETYGEHVLGQALLTEHVRPEDLVTDLPRVAFAAGIHPPQPIEWTAEKLRASVAARRAHFVVLGRKRDGREELMQEFSGSYLPVDIAGLVSVRDGRERLGFWRSAGGPSRPQKK